MVWCNLCSEKISLVTYEAVIFCLKLWALQSGITGWRAVCAFNMFLAAACQVSPLLAVLFCLRVTAPFVPVVFGVRCPAASQPLGPSTPVSLASLTGLSPLHLPRNSGCAARPSGKTGTPGPWPRKTSSSAWKAWMAAQPPGLVIQTQTATMMRRVTSSAPSPMTPGHTRMSTSRLITATAT